MKAMILAAGLGTRLRPLTDTTPKPLIPLNGRPLIEYAIALCNKHGITELVINLHHLGGLILDTLRDGSNLGVSISYSNEPEILGTGGGIKQMALHVGPESFWVLNSDILSEVDLSAVNQAHEASGAVATMVLRPHPIQSGSDERPTALFMDENSRIVTVASGAEIDARKNDNPLMFTGLHIINPTLLKRLPDGFSCIFQDAYRPAIEAGDKVCGFLYESYWRDLGTIDAYKLAEQDILAGNIPKL